MPVEKPPFIQAGVQGILVFLSTAGKSAKVATEHYSAILHHNLLCSPRCSDWEVQDNKLLPTPALGLKWFLKSGDRVCHSKWQSSQLKETTGTSWTFLYGEKSSPILLLSNSKLLFTVKARLWALKLITDIFRSKKAFEKSIFICLFPSSPPSYCWVSSH